MGIEKLIVGVNKNNILDRFFKSNNYLGFILLINIFIGKTL